MSFVSRHPFSAVGRVWPVDYLALPVREGRVPRQRRGFRRRHARAYGRDLRRILQGLGLNNFEQSTLKSYDIRMCNALFHRETQTV